LIIIIPAIYLFMIYNVDPEMEMNWPIVIMTKHLSYDIALMDFLIVWRDVILTAIILTIIIPVILSLARIIILEWWQTDPLSVWHIWRWAYSSYDEMWHEQFDHHWRGDKQTQRHHDEASQAW